MSIQSISFNPQFTQRSFASPTIDSGIQAGGVFDGRGHDFLDPDDILRSVNGFSQSVAPTSASNSNFLPLGTNPIAQNANSSNVLNSTNGGLNTIFAPNFGSSQLTPSAARNRDLVNFNPLIWENPTPNNVLLGTMDAASKILGGNGLFQPNPVPPLFPAINQPQPPFNNFATPVAQQAQPVPSIFQSGGGAVSFTQNGLALLQGKSQVQWLQQDIADLQALQARVLLLDQTGELNRARVQAQAALLQGQIDQKMLQLQNTQQAVLQLQAQVQQNNSVIPSNGTGGLLSNGSSSGQPFAVSGNVLVVPFQSLVALMEQFLNSPKSDAIQTNSIISRKVNEITINRLASPNGVPAWIG
jgi:hypothetical protein